MVETTLEVTLHDEQVGTMLQAISHTINNINEASYIDYKDTALRDELIELRSDVKMQIGYQLINTSHNEIGGDDG